jgi:hypothetical protein
MALALLGGCATAPDPEYARLLAVARTDCKGNEIVGVWARSSGMVTIVVLLRPDGTGLSRSICNTNRDPFFNRTVPLLWRYQGAGVWMSGTAIIRFAGNALVWEDHVGRTTFRLVYIRTGNESFN